MEPGLDSSMISSQLLDTPGNDRTLSTEGPTPGEHFLDDEADNLNVEGLSLQGIVLHPLEPTTSTLKAMLEDTPARTLSAPEGTTVQIHTTPTLNAHGSQPMLMDIGTPTGAPASSAATTTSAIPAAATTTSAIPAAAGPLAAATRAPTVMPPAPGPVAPLAQAAANAPLAAPQAQAPRGGRNRQRRPNRHQPYAGYNRRQDANRWKEERERHEKARRLLERERISMEIRNFVITRLGLQPDSTAIHDQYVEHLVEL